VRYVMRKELLIKQYIHDGNDKALNMANFSGILEKICVELQAMEESHLNVLKYKSLPLRAKPKMTAIKRQVIFKDVCEVKQSTQAFLLYVVPEATYVELDDYGFEKILVYIDVRIIMKLNGYTISLLVSQSLLKKNK
jgi:hypothetical protein